MGESTCFLLFQSSWKSLMLRRGDDGKSLAISDDWSSTGGKLCVFVFYPKVFLQDFEHIWEMMCFCLLSKGFSSRFWTHLGNGVFFVFDPKAFSSRYILNTFGFVFCLMKKGFNQNGFFTHFGIELRYSWCHNISWYNFKDFC